MDDRPGTDRDLIAAKDETIGALRSEVEHLRAELATRTDELQRRDVLLREAPRPDPRPRRRPGRPVVTSGGITTGHAPGPGAPVAPAVVAVLGSVTLDDAANSAALDRAVTRLRADRGLSLIHI